MALPVLIDSPLTVNNLEYLIRKIEKETLLEIDSGPRVSESLRLRVVH